MLCLKSYSWNQITSRTKGSVLANFNPEIYMLRKLISNLECLEKVDLIIPQLNRRIKIQRFFIEVN